MTCLIRSSCHSVVALLSALIRQETLGEGLSDLLICGSDPHNKLDL